MSQKTTDRSSPYAKTVDRKFALDRLLHQARGRFQAAESRPRLVYRKLTKKAATNYEASSEVTKAVTIDRVIVTVTYLLNV